MFTAQTALAQVVRVFAIGMAATMLGLGGCSKYGPMKVTINFFGGDAEKVPSKGAPLFVDVFAVNLPLDDDDNVDETKINADDPYNWTGDSYWTKNDKGGEKRVEDFDAKNTKGSYDRFYRKRFTSALKTQVLSPQDPIWRQWLDVNKANHLLIISNGGKQTNKASRVPLLRSLYEGDPEVTIAADNHQLQVTPRLRQ